MVFKAKKSLRDLKSFDLLDNALQLAHVLPWCHIDCHIVHSIQQPNYDDPPLVTVAKIKTLLRIRPFSLVHEKDVRALRFSCGFRVVQSTTYWTRRRTFVMTLRLIRRTHLEMRLRRCENTRISFSNRCVYA